jgi:protein-L-isoaspartate(D-aspartate) O-methyltransferase
VRSKSEPPKTDDSTSGADLGPPAANIAGLVRQVLQTQGLNLPQPFGRVEGGVYSQNKELAAALNFARSLREPVNVKPKPGADQTPKRIAPSDAVAQSRRFYAEELRFTARVNTLAVIEAFASVPRERFTGHGPWWIRSPMHMDAYWTTGDADPRHVYHDVLIALDKARGINNGQPSLWARMFDNLDIKAGEQVLHLGCGTGYYTAIAAELVGRAGHVTAVEIDRALAERAQKALTPWPQVEIVNTDGAQNPFEPVDVVVASAGATHPLPAWLDALKPGGRLLLPMTTAVDLAGGELSTARIALSAGGGPGAMLLVVREATNAFSARFLCRAGFVHFHGARDQAADRQLAAALARDWGSSVRSLRRDRHAEDASCWLHGDGWCLSRQDRGTDHEVL